MLVAVLAVLTFTTAGALAAPPRAYEVTVTNITKGQTFTPILGAAHRAGISLFVAGMPSSMALAELAEGGATGPLADLLAASPDLVSGMGSSGGLLGPGESVTFTIDTSRRFKRLSLAAMLLPTNDTFVALNGVRLPSQNEVFFAQAYDAGSEINDEKCDSIPGPLCGGAGFGDDDGEGFVHHAAGISGIGDLGPSAYDWRGAVARVYVKRVE